MGRGVKFRPLYRCLRMPRNTRGPAAAVSPVAMRPGQLTAVSAPFLADGGPGDCHRFRSHAGCRAISRSGMPCTASQHSNSRGDRSSEHRSRQSRCAAPFHGPRVAEILFATRPVSTDSTSTWRTGLVTYRAPRLECRVANTGSSYMLNQHACTAKRSGCYAMPDATRPWQRCPHHDLGLQVDVLRYAACARRRLRPRPRCWHFARAARR